MSYGTHELSTWDSRYARFSNMRRACARCHRNNVKTSSRHPWYTNRRICRDCWDAIDALHHQSNSQGDKKNDDSRLPA